MNTPTKICTKCGKEKPATTNHFHRQKRGLYGLRSKCKDCVSETDRERYWNDPEKARSRVKDYRQRYPEKVAAYNLAYRLADPVAHIERATKWNKENPDKKRVANRRYNRRHPDRGRRHQKAVTGRRKARKLNLPDNFTTNDWENCLDYWGGCCAYCGRPPGLWHTLAMDHFIALSSPDCPGTIPINIVPACHSRRDGEGDCNRGKHNKPPEQWLIAKFGERKAKKILKRIHAYFASLK